MLSRKVDRAFLFAPRRNEVAAFRLTIIHPECAAREQSRITAGRSRSDGPTRRVAVGAIVFLCPETKRGIDSGIEIDFRSRQMLHQNPVCLACPHCGNLHKFKIRQSYASDESDFDALFSPPASLSREILPWICSAVGTGFRNRYRDRTRGLKRSRSNTRAKAG